MKKEVSIVLTREVKNYRKLAQRWYGLTDEQMEDCDVHHNPSRHQGGRNIPEHLFVYHNTLHSAVHEDEFTLWAREGGKIGGVKCAKEKIGFHSATPEQRSEWSKMGSQKVLEMGVGVHAPGVREKGGKRAFEEKLGMFSNHAESIKKSHEVMKEKKVGIYGDTMSKKGASTKFVDPDHPELGAHNAGNLVKVQRSKGLPHGKENRRKVG